MDVLNINGRGLKKSLAGSFILHVIVLSAALIIFNEPGRQFVSPVYTVDLVGPGGLKEKAPATPGPPPAQPQSEVNKKEADVKEPPREFKKAEPKQEAKALPKEVVKVKEDSDPAVSVAVKRLAENIKKKQESALVSSKVEDIRKKKEADSKYASERLGEIRKELGSKNETAVTPQSPAQGAGTGGGRGLSGGNLQAKYPAYYNIIHDRVQENWIYPEGFELSKVSVIASMRISRAGALMDVWLEKSSGNARFDQSLLDAVKKAAPFPPLPQDLDGSQLETGLRFCPNCTE
ncbi:MAG: cell envelope integrity protein TolA [Deltaproteobacteria bacterium]|nr:cell envelope integrity protein TolA [Deltaproteobacteria bacterium]